MHTSWNLELAFHVILFPCQRQQPLCKWPGMPLPPPWAFNHLIPALIVTLQGILRVHSPCRHRTPQSWLWVFTSQAKESSKLFLGALPVWSFPILLLLGAAPESVVLVWTLRMLKVWEHGGLQPTHLSPPAAGVLLKKDLSCILSACHCYVTGLTARQGQEPEWSPGF